jgi:hypothetical protein
VHTGPPRTDARESRDDEVVDGEPLDRGPHLLHDTHSLVPRHTGTARRAEAADLTPTITTIAAPWRRSIQQHHNAVPASTQHAATARQQHTTPRQHAAHHDPIHTSLRSDGEMDAASIRTSTALPLSESFTFVDSTLQRRHSHSQHPDHDTNTDKHMLL